LNGSPEESVSLGLFPVEILEVLSCTPQGTILLKPSPSVDIIHALPFFRLGILFLHFFLSFRFSSTMNGIMQLLEKLLRP
jgi:hypothetical protein